MRHIHRYFNGVEIGGVCTGTISYFGLPVKALLDKGIIALQDVRTQAEEVAGFKMPATRVEDYVFRGFHNAGGEEDSDGYPTQE